MDAAYNQHSPHTRRHNRSATNLNHLTLAPLTSRLPISDSDDLPEPDSHHISYIEGRSAPTTPSILSRSSSRVSLRKKPPQINLPKSKSSTHLIAGKQPRQTPITPGAGRLRQSQAVSREEFTISSLSSRDRNDSDWLLRTSASISTSTRESKGQAWLVSRASSTSLTAQRDEDEEEFERTLAREREQTSRRGSVATVDADDEFSPVNNRRSLSFGPPNGARSRPLSRFGSRSHSRSGSKGQLFTPGAVDREGYFDQQMGEAELIVEPDFVNNEEEIYNGEDPKTDEEVVRKLARANSAGLGGWVERMLGWSLFAVDEDGEDGEEAEVDMDEKAESSDVSSRRGGGVEESRDYSVPNMPPLRDDETGGWQDAAWLLSVASKVLL